MISIEDIASPASPAGGGAAAALVVAIAAALVEKVCAIAKLGEGRRDALSLRNSATELAVRDAAAFASMRDGRSRDAATLVPLEIAETARLVAALAGEHYEQTKPFLQSDLDIAIGIARAAIESAQVLVRVNRA